MKENRLSFAIDTNIESKSSRLFPGLGCGNTLAYGVNGDIMRPKRPLLVEEQAEFSGFCSASPWTAIASRPSFSNGALHGLAQLLVRRWAVGS